MSDIKNNHLSTPTNRSLAVVTGASSGIGYELAVQFATHEFDVVIVAEDDAIHRVAEKLEQHGTAIYPIQQDLASFEGVQAFFQQVKEMDRPIAAIAINAGIGVGGKFFETDLQDEIRLINLNVVSYVHLSKLVVQEMIERGEAGKILFTSSIASMGPGPYHTVYAASKAFIQSFAQALRYELDEKGISVTALMPGATDTNFFHRAGMDNTKVGAQEKDDPADVAKQGFEALMDGKESIIAGSLKTKLGNMANDFIPDSIKAKKSAGMTKPGSASEVKKEEMA